MKATWEKLENNQGVLTIEVEEARVDQAIDQAFAKVVKKVNVPGFRKGKVPRKIFEARFGVESLYQDALDIILPEAYTEAVQETGIEPVDRPEVDVEQIGKGQPLVFKATVTVKPEVKLGDYKGLTVEEKDFTVTDEAVEEELKQMQNRSAELVVLEDGAAIEKGDYAIIDFKGFVDGEAFEGGEAENYQLEIGSGTFIPGFEDQIIGLKKGDEKDIEVTFPEDYHAAELAGKPAVFKVKVNEIKRKNLPELDDEFAKDVSEFDTLDELKADIKNKLEEKAKTDAENYKKESLIEKATENAEINLPEVMVENEVNHMVNDFAQRLQYQGMNLDLYYQFTGLDEEKLREQFQPDAEKRVRTTLVLEAIGKAENVEVTDEDVNNELEELSKQYNRPVEELRKIFEGRDNLESLKNDIRIRKTIDLLVENSK
ncbi:MULTISPECIES: trigger factor [Aneurinibacillus]|jgi:trigger factor|uniref:Trigger factor n=1 Tax=Aneurinibacillus danicus TaxID=267746 RepID=A0A511V4I2_9BACL|nr:MULTISPECIES: trigger factor [Aneurinibacillus]GEN32991.1 trigger factor [Aneurinibacillus danicus]